MRRSLKRISVPDFVEVDASVRAELQARALPQLQAELSAEEASRSESNWLALLLAALGIGTAVRSGR